MLKTKTDYIDINQFLKNCEFKSGDNKGELDFYKYELYKMLLIRFFDEYEEEDDNSEKQLLNKDRVGSEAYEIVKNTLIKDKILK